MDSSKKILLAIILILLIIIGVLGFFVVILLKNVDLSNNNVISKNISYPEEIEEPEEEIDDGISDPYLKNNTDEDYKIIRNAFVEPVNDEKDGTILVNKKNEELNLSERDNIVAILSYSRSGSENWESIERYYIYKNNNGKYVYEKVEYYLDYNEFSVGNKYEEKEINSTDDLIRIDNEQRGKIKEINEKERNAAIGSGYNEYRKNILFVDYIFISNKKEQKMDLQGIIYELIRKDENYNSNIDGQNVAYIQYSFGMNGMSDSGHIERYLLYYNNDGTYDYKVMESNITIAGRSEETLKEEGKLKSRSDVRDLDEKIKKETEDKNTEETISEYYVSARYVYINPNGWEEQVNSVEDLVVKYLY